ncbi:hypothetical protein ACEYYA_08895 [Paracoccus sp. p3-h83]|uniref:hypothetical protein n=1 Tax=Paracoccus sp. p3-h83 TaxID=3342805 RepID=UPI0035B8881C
MTRSPLAVAALMLGAIAMTTPAHAKDGCPPGLAKQGRCDQVQPKAKPAKPAPKAETPEGILAPGSILGDARYYTIADPALFGLPALIDGSHYVIAGDQILRAEADSFRVIDTVRALTPRDCPPGLAKKEPACIPPGQVGRIRAALARDIGVARIDDPLRLGLPIPDGAWDYALVEGTIIRFDPATRDLLGLVRQVDGAPN